MCNKLIVDGEMLCMSWVEIVGTECCNNLAAGLKMKVSFFLWSQPREDTTGLCLRTAICGPNRRV